MAAVNDAAFDPIQALLQRMPAANIEEEGTPSLAGSDDVPQHTTTSFGGSDTPSSPIDSPSNDDHSVSPSNSVQQLASPVTPPILDIAQAARQAKRARRLAPQSETEIDIFLAGNAFEREAQQYAATLECRDMLQMLTRDVDWDIPEALKTTIQDYTWVYILSPTLTSYRSIDGPARVLKVMRQFNLSGLPPPYETGRCAIVEACIGKAMTDCRHHIKTKVNESLKADARARDIASLAAQIIGRSRIKPTAALYMRLANIRWAITQLPGKFSEDAFWVKFDAILEGQRAKYTEPGHLYTAVKKLYDDDVKQYGEPDLASYPTINPDRQEEWVTALDTSAGSAPVSNEVTGTRRRKARA